jgi:tetratricopeptide (TPR) repeat protein
MSTAARIEELRNKFEENARRYFAPLANELRKAGDLTQAIALCREHLPKQPGHMSGYIVFGQALYESGELDEGRVVFEQALALDPENLIALHHLGHIAKQRGDTPLARRWYERALETDPRNDDIAHQLAALATPVRPVAPFRRGVTSGRSRRRRSRPTR